jgi:hypothetical protein
MFHMAGAWAADAPGFLEQLRASRHFRHALDRLKQAAILAPDVKPAEVKDIHVGRVLVMGMLMVHLDAAPQRRVRGRQCRRADPRLDARRPLHGSAGRVTRLSMEG